jgi:hypothetical protein
MMIGSSVLLFNYFYQQNAVISPYSILEQPSLLKKFNDGYTEVCFRNIVNMNDPHSPVVRTCLLDANKWKIEGSNDFYIRMVSDDFCTYRLHETDKYYDGHKTFGAIYDSKKDGTCNIPSELNWERKSWDYSIIHIPELKNKEFIYMNMYRSYT